MTTVNTAASVFSRVIAVVGASSDFGAKLLLHFEEARPDFWMVAIADKPLRWPVERVSSYRLAQNRVGGTLTLADIPDVMQEKAWDLFSQRHELTMAEMPDALQLENVDALVHVGSHYDGPDQEAFVNRVPRWVEAARIAGVGQFVYLSDIRAYGIGPNTPTPVTEKFSANPVSSHRYLVECEPAPPPPDGPPVPPSPGIDDPDAMRIAVLRTAMSVGSGNSSPVTDDLLLAALASGRKRDFPLQFLHQHDLARAIEAAVAHSLNGVFNVAGDGVVSSRDVLDMCDVPKTIGRTDSIPLKRSAGAMLSKWPLIISGTKFKQQADFRFKYSSAQAARVYCHSVLLEPA